MENNIIDSAGTGSSGIMIDQQTVIYLDEIRRWANFLAIMGFIGIIILVIIGAFLGAILTDLAGPMASTVPIGFISIFYMVFAVIYFFPVLYLYRFALLMKVALRESNQEKLNSSFRNMKSLFRFFGILTIAVLSLYAIIFISAIVFSAFQKF